jgi:hypothetical protein
MNNKDQRGQRRDWTVGTTDSDRMNFFPEREIKVANGLYYKQPDGRNKQ